MRTDTSTSFIFHLGVPLVLPRQVRGKPVSDRLSLGTEDCSGEPPAGLASWLRRRKQVSVRAEAVLLNTAVPAKFNIAGTSSL